MARKMPASLKARKQQDLDKRSVNGSYIYLLAWLLISLGTGLHRSDPDLFWPITTIFFVLGLARIGGFLLSDKLREKSENLWFGAFCINALAPAIVISVAFSISLTSAEHNNMFIYLLMMMFALISAGSVNFSPHLTLSYAYLLCLVIPPLLAAVFSKSHAQEAVMLVLYAMFMAVQIMRLSREYLQMIEQQLTLQELNNRDPLTGIYNRRYFSQATEQIWKYHLRTDTNLALIMLDIDHFKKVNDNYGHSVGDKVICMVSDAISGVFKRETDTIARLGGEEFAAVVCTQDEQSAEQLAEKVRKTISGLGVIADKETISVTVSIGIANCRPDHDINTEAWYHQADKCLYAAKNGGRNRVVSSTYSPTAPRKSSANPHSER